MNQEYEWRVTLTIVTVIVVSALLLFFFVKRRVKEDPELEEDILSFFMPRVKLSEKEVLLKLRGASIAYDDISLDAVTKYLNKLVRDKKLESQKNNLVLYG